MTRSALGAVRRTAFECVAACAVATLGLAACGGGDGAGSGGETGSSFDAAKAQQVTFEALGTLDRNAGTYTFTQHYEAQSTNRFATNSPLNLNPRLSLLAAPKAGTQQALAQPQSVTVENCPYGGTRTDELFADGSSKHTENNCSYIEGSLWNGTYETSNVASTADRHVFDANSVFSITSVNEPFDRSDGTSSEHVEWLSAPSQEIDSRSGNQSSQFRQGANGRITTFSSTYRTVTVQDRTFNPNRFEVTSELTFNISRLDTSYTVQTRTPCYRWQGHFYPYTGVIEIVGANGYRLRVTVLGDETLGDNSQLQIDVDANGDGNWDGTVFTTWDTVLHSWPY